MYMREAYVFTASAPFRIIPFRLKALNPIHLILTLTLFLTLKLTVNIRRNGITLTMWRRSISRGERRNCSARARKLLRKT